VPALNVQVQPGLSPDLDLAGVLALFSTAAELADAELEVTAGEDDGPYVNYDFRTRDLARLWDVLQTQVFMNRAIGPRLARASIATCEGSRGWDDYLLLHHYDRSFILDSLPID
jgi:hypothetical protein